MLIGVIGVGSAVLELSFTEADKHYKNGWIDALLPGIIVEQKFIYRTDE